MRATSTTSNPSRREIFRTASRSLRFNLFLTTAFPFRFPTEKPTRLTSRELRRAPSTCRPSDQLRPPDLTAAKSLGLVRRCSLPMEWLATRLRPGGLGCNGDQTVSRVRPLNMRRFNTLRPPRLNIRDLNP